MQIKSKTVMNWSSRKKEECISCNVYFVRRNFLTFVFYRNVCVLNKLSECVYFYISKNINLYTFVACFLKILKAVSVSLRFCVSRDQCKNSLKQRFYRDIWETLLYDNRNYNSYKFSYNLAFIPFLLSCRNRIK